MSWHAGVSCRLVPRPDGAPVPHLTNKASTDHWVQSLWTDVLSLFPLSGSVVFVLCAWFSLPTFSLAMRAFQVLLSFFCVSIHFHYFSVYLWFTFVIYCCSGAYYSHTEQLPVIPTEYNMWLLWWRAFCFDNVFNLASALAFYLFIFHYFSPYNGV